SYAARGREFTSHGKGTAHLAENPQVFRRSGRGSKRSGGFFMGPKAACREYNGAAFKVQFSKRRGTLEPKTV
ncbi:MAG TPA: hypothetical protein VN369_07905, partial [Terriglobales bacterium]|nr:hypothetical protein [Terriglobales bacterium]